MSHEKPEDNAPQQRARLRAARAAMSPAARDRGALLMRGRLFTWLANYRDAALRAGRPAPATIAAFWPMADEPDLRAVMRQWAEDAALTVALPVIVAAGEPLAFHRWTPDTAMTEGRYGIAIPADGQPVQPDVALVPTLGFTAAGDRLGYGAGYYDRTLAALHRSGAAPVTIGIAWACCELDSDYQPAPHDQPLDAILTEAGWIPHAPGGKPGPLTRSLFTTRV